MNDNIKVVDGNDKFSKIKLFDYLLITGISVVVIVTLLFTKNLWTEEDLQIKIKILADVFTAVSSIILCIGILSFVSSKGALDGFLYGCKVATSRLIPFRKYERIQYHDYIKNKKRPDGFTCFFIVGAFLMIVAIIFTILFYVV